MANNTKTPSRLEVTPKGTLLYPNEFCKFDKDDKGWELNKGEPKQGERIWRWNYNRRMTKRSVGTVVSS